MSKPIYKPRGAAAEYGDLAINIYTGCPHRCFYCYAPQVLRKDREEFHSHVEPRKNIVEDVIKQLEREQITGKLIHLCFTCDPYPTGCDTSATREIIKAIKAAGNNVQILTKGDGSRDFDLLDSGDWYGITFDGGNDCVRSSTLSQIEMAHKRGIKTWVSFEPVLDGRSVLMCISLYHEHIDKAMIGKLNYHSSDIDWAAFGKKADDLCSEIGLEYYIKDSLRRVMEE